MVPVRLIRPPTLSGITFCQNQESEADGELQRNVRRNQVEISSVQYASPIVVDVNFSQMLLCKTSANLQRHARVNASSTIRVVILLD